MILYHGSNQSVETIDLTLSKRAKDFGQGFYLSQDRQQAQKMAELTTFRTGYGTPTVSPFQFDERILTQTILNVKTFDGYTDDWAEFIALNRRNYNATQAHAYDIVVGPIANDTVGVQIRRFMSGYIDVQRLIKELSYVGGITYQYFFGSEKAIQYLTRS